MAEDKAFTTRKADFSAWYNEVVLRAELADYSPVRGCMVIRPWGYAIWERMQRALDDKLKESGHENAYFPLLIPMSFLEREAKHIEGFAPEVAVVTHAGGKELEEPFAIRPTSETIIYAMFAKWVQSYRDLPILMNQWANVMRWEMRTRLFLRTAEFLWQEGHTAHKDEPEAEEEALRILGIYRDFMEQWICLPVVTGLKTDAERFAGAVRTYSLEALMQDNRALQAGTSHMLGQNFAKQFDLKFQTEAGGEDYAYNTSWGVTTRLIGAMVMTHGDDNGVVIPPRLAPTQVVIVPIYRSDDERALVLEKANSVASALKQQQVRVHIDARDNMKPGAKYYEWERKGVPMRVEIGPKDVANKKLVVVLRLELPNLPRKEIMEEAAALSSIPARLDQFHQGLHDAALARREANSHRGITDYAKLRELLEADAGFVYAGFCGSPECETKVKDDTKATIRNLPQAEFRSKEKPAKCVVCGRDAIHEAIWARAY